METIEQPGSLNDFKEANPGAQDMDYFEQLDKFRQSQAERLGVTPEQLHKMGNTAIQTALHGASSLEEVA